jgi:hypothetical protein
MGLGWGRGLTACDIFACKEEEQGTGIYF